MKACGITQSHAGEPNATSERDALGSGDLALSSEKFQLREKVSQDGITFDDCRIAYGWASPIDAPGYLVCQNWRRREHRRRPVGIDEPADRRHVPDFLRPADMVVRVSLEAFGEKLADFAMRLDVAFDFGDRAVQVGGDAHAGDQDERRAAV